MTAPEFHNRNGEPIRVGDRVAVFSFTVEGIPGGIVTGLSVATGARRVKVPMATIQRADGTVFTHRVLFLEPVR